MLTTIALILSIALQLVAVSIVISLIKGSKYKSSWILLSIGLTVMAIRRLIELIDYYKINENESVTQLNNWLGVLISVLIVVGVFYMKKIFEYIAEMQEIRQKSEKEVLSAIINTEERERKRMANELHDGIGPLLSSIKMSLHTLAVGNKYTADQLVLHKNITESVSEAIRSLREISYNLSPAVLEDFGLVTALRSFIGKTQPAIDFKIEFVSNITDEHGIGKNASVILYRAVCELINNALKHAEATKVMISLHQENDRILLLYQDDGKGFNYDSPMKREPLGMGLHTIQSRINSINGLFVLKSQPGDGVMVTIEINTKQNEPHRNNSHS